MAREVHQREDLLRDATALLPRFQLKFPGDDASFEVFVGFREAAMSVYFGEDPVYHFNSQMQLRRAFVDDRLLKAERGKLIAWQPQRTEASTTMLRHDLSDEEQATFGETVAARLDWLHEQLSGNRFEVLGQVPSDGDAVARLREWLDGFSRVTFAASAKVG